MTRESRLLARHCARRAALRTAVLLRLQWPSPIHTLRAIAWSAPLLGLLAATLNLKDVFRAYSSPTWDLCDCAGGYAETLAPIALSLPVAILATFASHIIAHRAANLAGEARLAALHLLDSLR